MTVPNSADTQPTLPLEPLPTPQFVEAPRLRRRRWPWFVAVALVLVVGLGAAAEFVARGVVAGSIRNQVIDALSLPEDQQLDVATGGFMLRQLAIGRLDEVQVSSDSIAVGPFTGAVAMSATGVDLRGGPLDEASGTVRVDADQLTTLLAAGADLPVDTIELSGSDVTASGSISVFDIDIPLSITLTPGADQGDLTLTPVSATVAGAKLDIAALAERFGSMVGGVLETQRICIADRLPAGVRLDEVTVSGKSMTAAFTVNGEIGIDATLLEPGTCS